jgi:CBS domain containing-hemolysin-like protein
MTIFLLLVALVLLLANGFFVAAEFGLIAARPSRLEQLRDSGDNRAHVALASTKQISFMLAGTQLGITMASLGLGYVAEPAVARLIESGLEGWVDLPQAALHSVSIVIALSIVVFLHMVFGEMAPKNIAIAEPERTALRVAYPYRLYVRSFGPFIRFLNALARGVLTALRVEQKKNLSAARSSEEIGFLIAESAKEGVIEGFEHRLLTSAVAFGSRDAAAVMVPRTELRAVPSTVTPRALEQVVLETGHSRLPVFGKDLDNVLGFFHAKDLLKIRAGEWDRPLRRSLIRQMLVVPESLRLHPLMLDMRKQRKHFALVVEEHGGTAGIVTLEDLLEELVGEILDEYDEDETGVQRLPGERYLVPGNLRIDEAATRLGVRLPEGEYETLAGFLMDQLGRIPRRRDQVAYEGWRLRVLRMHRRRVVQILVEPQPAPPPSKG